MLKQHEKKKNSVNSSTNHNLTKKSLMLQSQENKENTNTNINTSLNNVNVMNVNSNRNNSFNTLSSTSNEENLIESKANKNFLFKSNNDLEKTVIPTKKTLSSSLNDIRMQEQSSDDPKSIAQSIFSVPTPPPLPPPASIQRDLKKLNNSLISGNQKINKRINWEKIEDKNLLKNDTIWQDLTARRPSLDHIINQFNLDAVRINPPINQANRC